MCAGGYDQSRVWAQAILAVGVSGRERGSVATGDRCGLNPDTDRKVRFIMYDIPRSFEIRMNPPFRFLFDRLSILTAADIDDIKYQYNIKI